MEFCLTSMLSFIRNVSSKTKFDSITTMPHFNTLIFPVLLQTKKAGRRRGEKETRGRGTRASKAGTSSKRKREEKAGGEEAAVRASPEDERDGRKEEER